MNPRYLLGLDVGGTKIAAAVANAATGVVLAETVAPSSRGGGISYWRRLSVPWQRR